MATPSCVQCLGKIRDIALSIDALHVGATCGYYIETQLIDGDRMSIANPCRTSHHIPQFGLRSPMEFVTICAVLSACSSVTGIGASVCLMLLALSVWARVGWLAVALLMAASLVADVSLDAADESLSFARQLVVFLLASSLLFWYDQRRRWRLFTPL